MVDWFTGDVGIDATALSLDHIYEVTRFGDKVYDIEKWLKVDGSYLSSIQLRRGTPRATLIDKFKARQLPCPQFVVQLSGNPAKFLQGQNCYGPKYEQLEQLIESTLAAFPPDLGLRPQPAPIACRRIDLTTMVDLKTHERVHDWLRQAADRSRSRHGRPLVAGTSVYWGSKNGWGIKTYCKACELQAHPFADLGLNDKFRESVKTQLRVELTLRTRELKQHEHIDESLIWQYFGRVELGMLKTTDILNGGDLPTASLMVYRAWLSGYPIDQELQRRTFYRHRRRILDEIGIDISTSPATVLERQSHVCMDSEYLREHESTGDPPDVFKPFLWRPFQASDLSTGVTDTRVQAEIV